MADAGIRIRAAELADVPALAALCTELGYPCTSSDIEKRLRHILALRGHAVFAAERDDAGGWVHVLLSILLERDPQAEIGGLVVSAGHHGCGAGRLLMRQAEEWAALHGAEAVFLRSNVVREGAHAFYAMIEACISSAAKRGYVTIDELKREALGLDPSVRADLARELLESLDDLSDSEVERLWLEEAERRRTEVRAGRATPIPMDEVFARARAARA